MDPVRVLVNGSVDTNGVADVGTGVEAEAGPDKLGIKDPR